MIKKNPNKGTFVDWRHLDNLNNFSKENPELAYYLIVNLFNEKVELSTRIDSFKEIVKKYNKDCFLGTSLFAYLMSAFDSHNYTIYKDDVFQEFGDLFDIQIPSSVSEKYEFYIKLCHELLDYFRQNSYLDCPLLLDIQDFIFSISAYNLSLEE